MAEDITKLGEAMAAVDKDIRQEVGGEKPGPRRFPPQAQTNEPRSLPLWLRQQDERLVRVERRLETIGRWLGIET